MDDTLRDALLLAFGANPTARLNVVPHVITTDPVTGGDWMLTVPPNTIWVPLSVAANFASSATAVTRDLSLVIRPDGVNIASRIWAFSGIVASTTTLSTTWTRGVGYAMTLQGGAVQTMGLASLPIPAGGTIGSATYSLQAGDVWSAIVLYALVVTQRTADEVGAYVGEAAAGSPQWDPYAGAELGL